MLRYIGIGIGAIVIFGLVVAVMPYAIIKVYIDSFKLWRRGEYVNWHLFKEVAHDPYKPKEGL